MSVILQQQFNKLNEAYNDLNDAYGKEMIKSAKLAAELASLKRKLEEEFDGEVDITSTGAPNAAMRVMMIVRGER